MDFTSNDSTPLKKFPGARYHTANIVTITIILVKLLVPGPTNAKIKRDKNSKKRYQSPLHTSLGYRYSFQNHQHGRIHEKAFQAFP